MGDPMTTGLHTTGFLVEKGFDRIPAAVFAGDTYRKFLPKVIRPAKKISPSSTTAAAAAAAEISTSPDRDASSSSRRRSSNDMAYAPRGHQGYEESNGSSYGSGGYGAPYPSQYSAYPPRQRPEYLPRYDRYANPTDDRRARDDDDAYYNRSVARRPPGAMRRTSSFNGRNAPRETLHDADDDEAAEACKQEHHLREDFLTKSPEGLAAGGLGAVVGGFLAEKAQVKAGREERGSGSFFLTGLGAVVGGLAANAAVDHFQHRRSQHARQDARWERKWGEPEDRRDRARQERRRNEDPGDAYGEYDGSAGGGRARSEGGRRHHHHHHHANADADSPDRGGSAYGGGGSRRSRPQYSDGYD